jgi:hypothetical protein
MSAGQAVLLVGASLVIIAVMIAVLLRVNQSERRLMERRREEWIAGGCIPEEEPNFYSGRGDVYGAG